MNFICYLSPAVFVWQITFRVLIYIYHTEAKRPKSRAETNVAMKLPDLVSWLAKMTKLQLVKISRVLVDISSEKGELGEVLTLFGQEISFISSSPVSDA